MMNKLLKSPQFLSGLSIVIALIGAGYILIGLLRHFDSQVNKPITVATIGGTLTVNTVNRSIGLDFGEVFELSNGAALIKWGDNTAIAIGNTVATINNDNIVVTAGTLYLDTSSAIRISNELGSPNYLTTANDTSAIIETIPFRTTIMSGLLEDHEGNTFSRNWQVELNGTAFTASRFERELLITNSVWSQISGSLAEFEVTEEWLNDRVAPELLSVQPASGSEVAESSFGMKITVDDPTTRITINGNDGSIDEDGTYLAQISLGEGANTIEVVLRDEFGNKSEAEVVYTYKKPVVSTPTNNQTVSSNCSDNSFRNGLIPLINNHRADNGLAPLSATTQLNAAACAQSTYMSSLGQLTHTGEGGSSFAQRCQATGAVCDAENVASATPTITPTQTFELWKNSADHNQNMLGNHSQIGVAAFGNFVTAVFN